MKKAKTVVLILLLFVMLAACYTGSLWFVRTGITPSGHFTMDEEFEQNYAVTDSGEEDYSCPIGFRDGKLYYYFQANSGAFQHSGIYEISESGAKLVSDDYNSVSDYFKGIKPKPMDDYEEEINEAPNDEDDKILTKLNDIYIPPEAKNYEEDEKSLYTVIDNSVIYLSKDLYIKEVDIKTHKCILKQKLKDNILNMNNLWEYELIKYGDEVLLTDNFSDNHFVIYSVTDNFSKVFSENLGDEYNSCEYYKGDLFIGSNSGGVYRVNLKTRKTTKLCGYKAMDFYFFGDKWVYFNDGDGNLYRTARDGSKSEILFNKGW